MNALTLTGFANTVVIGIGIGLGLAIVNAVLAALGRSRATP